MTWDFEDKARGAGRRNRSNKGTREGAGFQKCCGGSRSPGHVAASAHAGWSPGAGSRTETRRHLREMLCACIAHSTATTLLSLNT